jgi:hypothetical protein
MNTLTPQEVATLLGCKVACCKSYEWSGAKYIYYAISNGTPINITYYYAKKPGQASNSFGLHKKMSDCISWPSRLSQISS